MAVKGEDTIYCTDCGFSQRSDKYGFLHNASGIGEEIRHVSDWSRLIYNRLKERICAGKEDRISCKTQICMVDDEKHKFLPVGTGTVTLTQGKFRLEGTLNGETICKDISVVGTPTLPFSPGKHLELQDGATIYRCVLEDGKLVMKFINMLKIFYELSQNKTQIKAS